MYQYDERTEWGNTWVRIAQERFSYSPRDDSRVTEVMEVPDGVVMMTTVVTIGVSGSSSSINTMFIPRVKLQGLKLVPM